jgi:23S rRNA pseudouridine2605 synthase
VIRLQKVIADRGVASRRAAEEMITEGRVRVNGDLITALGTRVADDAHVEVDGKLIPAPSAHRYVLLYKPIGIVSTANDEHGRRTVVDHIGARERLYPVGRLDTDSEGLLLLTNDGTWAQRALHPSFGHEREYDVTVEGDLTDEALARLQRGIPLEEGIARAVRITVRSRSHGRSRLSMVLRTGWKRQVRRMCSAVGVKVSRLVRVRMGPLELGRLRPGEFRDLTKKEIEAMTKPGAPPRHVPERAQAEPAQVAERKTQARPSQVTRSPQSRSIEPRVARRAPPARARVGPVESARRAPRPMQRAGYARASLVGPRPSGVAPRVTRRGGSSRARVEAPRGQPFGARAAQAGRSTRERGPGAAAGPAARFRTRGAAARAVAPRAQARPPTRRGGVPREKRVSARQRTTMDGRG